MSSSGGPQWPQDPWGAGDRGAPDDWRRPTGGPGRPDQQAAPGSGASGWGQAPEQWGQPQQQWQSPGGQQSWGQPQQQWGQAPGPHQPPQWGPGPTGPGGRPPSGSKLPLLIGVAVVTLLLIGAAAWFALGSGSRQAGGRSGTTTAPASGSAPARQSTGPSDTGPRPPAPSSDPATPGASSPQTGEVGRAVPFRTDEGEGELIVHEARWTTEGIAPPQHGTYLGMDVEVKVTRGTYRYGPIYFSGKDASGREYSFAIGDSFDPELRFGTLTAGQNARGWVTLDCPRAPMTVSMSDSLIEPVVHVRVAP